MSNYINGYTRLVVCAANKYGNHVFLGARHFDERMIEAMEHYNVPNMRNHHGEVQGFVDQHGVFMDREEALKVAIEAGQINHYRTKTKPENKLFSEDLY